MFVKSSKAMWILTIKMVTENFLWKQDVLRTVSNPYLTSDRDVHVQIFLWSYFDFTSQDPSSLSTIIFGGRLTELISVFALLFEPRS
jgi:hypothetical protein